jgi:hypothetical protein
VWLLGNQGGVPGCAHLLMFGAMELVHVPWRAQLLESGYILRGSLQCARAGADSPKQLDHAPALLHAHECVPLWCFAVVCCGVLC